MSTLDTPFLTEQSPPHPHPFSSTLPSPPSPGEEVKQADVVLLGYPVPFPLSPHVRRQNLEIYEAVTSPHGPAMALGQDLNMHFHRLNISIAVYLARSTYLYCQPGIGSSSSYVLSHFPAAHRNSPDAERNSF